MALDEHDLCEVCDDRIEEPRVAVGLRTCWRCCPRPADAPPWDEDPPEGRK